MVPKKARATSADCSNTSKAPWQKDLTADLMGQKIRVLWPPDNIYYYGRVFRYHKKSKEHSIVYEGLNDIETIDLRTRKHEVLRNSKEEDAKQIGKVINILPPNKANIPTNHDAMIIGTEVEDDSDDPDADLDQDQDEDESETELDEDDIETEPDTEIEIDLTVGDYPKINTNVTKKIMPNKKKPHKSRTKRSDGKTLKHQLIYISNRFLYLVDLTKKQYKDVAMDKFRSKDPYFPPSDAD